MCLSQSRLALLLGLMFLAGLAGCGQTAPDNAPNLGARASAGGPPLSKEAPSPGNNSLTPITPAVSPAAPASRNEVGAASSEKATVPRGDNPHDRTDLSAKPTDSPESLVVPAWIAQELDSPDVNTRLRALETWAQSAPPGEVDPLIIALEDHDERVQARAMELIEQDLARVADTEQSGGGPENTNEIAESTDTMSSRRLVH